jgi:hypothetical protein
MRKSSLVIMLLIMFLGVCVLTSSVNAEYNSGRYNFSRNNFNSVPHGEYIWNNKANQTIAEMYPDSNKMGLLEGTVNFLSESLNTVVRTISSFFDNN